MLLSLHSAVHAHNLLLSKADTALQPLDSFTKLEKANTSSAQVFALLPRSRENLAAYVSWASAARQAGVYLAEHAQGCMRVDVPAGATLFIPGKIFLPTKLHTPTALPCREAPG